MGTEKGQGLGLAICHSIVNKHGGLITVESRPGNGTNFHVYFPAAEQAAPGIAQEIRQEPGRQAILFMDDEVRVRDIGSRILESLGYEVELAKNGEEAIEAVGKAKEAGRSFDAVILDLTVKEGMGGREALQKLKEIDPDMKAIVSSGYADDPIMKDFHEHGFTQCNSKAGTPERNYRSWFGDDVFLHSYPESFSGPQTMELQRFGKKRKNALCPDLNF